MSLLELKEEVISVQAVTTILVNLCMLSQYDKHHVLNVADDIESKASMI